MLQGNEYGASVLRGVPVYSPAFAGTKLYCLVTEAHRYEKLAQSFYAIVPGRDSKPRPLDRESDALPQHHDATTKPDNPVDWVGWIGDHSLLAMKLRRFDLMKLETEMMGTPRKINAILLNITINRPKLVMCRYKLATYWQNFTEIYLTWKKISQKVLEGGTLLTHTVESLVP